MAYKIQPRERSTNRLSSEENQGWRGLKALMFWGGAACVCALGGAAALSLAPDDFSANKKPMLAVLEQQQQNPGIDTSITTGSVQAQTFNSFDAASSRDMDAIRLTLSSMQRQINALQARNDRLEQALRGLRSSGTDSVVTGSVPQGSKPDMMTKDSNMVVAMPKPNMDQSMQDQASMALARLSESETNASSQTLATEMRDMNRQRQEIMGLDIGPGVSFDDLRQRWESLRQNGNESINSLNARAVLRESADGLRAHLILGPVAGQEQAQRYCSALLTAGAAVCNASNFEGQKL